MSRTDPDLTALIGSRICHDLISPLGAISNGVELLRMNGACNGPELDLIAESVENANARIRFFRVAFGAAAAEQSLSSAEARSIVEDVTRGGRLSVRWRYDGAVVRPELKLAFLLLQCLEHAMPWGGEVAVDRPAQAWRITGRSERLQVDDALWAALGKAKSSRAPSAAEAQFALAPATAAALGRAIRMTRRDGEIVVVA